MILNGKMILRISRILGTLQLNDLNLRLPHQNQLIHNLFDHIESFENKLMLYNVGNPTKKMYKTHFPCLLKYNVTSIHK